MLCFGSAVTLNFPMMLWTAIGPRGVVAVKSSVSIRAPFFVRTCLTRSCVFWCPGDPGQRSPKPATCAV